MGASGFFWFLGCGLKLFGLTIFGSRAILFAGCRCGSQLWDTRLPSIVVSFCGFSSVLV